MTARKREQHGMSRTPTYHAWASMKQRCYNAKQNRFARYIGRGIQVCERWRNSFIAFLEDMGEMPEGMSLDRIDNDGDYCPENCRWATATQQANNTHRTRYITINGEKRLARDMAEEFGISYGLVSNRLTNGWTLEQALELEEHHDRRAITIDGQTLTMAQWAQRMGLSRQAVHIRINQGWSVNDACSTPKGLPNPTMKRKKIRSIKMRANALGATLTELRQMRNWTQEDVARRIGKTPSAISGYEVGKVEPRFATVRDLAQIFDTPLDDLLAQMGKSQVLTHVNTCDIVNEEREVEMNQKDRERGTWLQVRMSEEDKALLARLSQEYGMSVSAFVRMMIVHFDEKRPTVALRFGPKVDALATEMTGV